VDGGGVGVVKSITGVLLGPGAPEVEDGLICLPREVVDNLDLDPGIIGWGRMRGGSGRRALAVANRWFFTVLIYCSRPSTIILASTPSDAS
jgi:hypothetical protein